MEKMRTESGKKKDCRGKGSHWVVGG